MSLNCLLQIAVEFTIVIYVNIYSETSNGLFISFFF